MPVRMSEAAWKGGLRNGMGRMRTVSGTCEGPYSFASRFEQAFGTNPEELLGAAHAGCFSMALAGEVEKAGYNPQEIRTRAKVTLGKSEITQIELETEAEVPGIEENLFLSLAETAKSNCPLSKALASVAIRLNARLIISAVA